MRKPPAACDGQTGCCWPANELPSTGQQRARQAPVFFATEFTAHAGEASDGVAAISGLSPFLDSTRLNAVSSPPFTAFQFATAVLRSEQAHAHALNIGSVGAWSP